MKKPYQLLLFDEASHAILHVDGTSGRIRGETPYPAALEPIEAITAARLVYILAVDENSDHGTVLRYAPTASRLAPSRRLEPLPIPDISPTQIAFDRQTNQLILSADGGRFYSWSQNALQLLGQSDRGAFCSGIQSQNGQITAIWEQGQIGLVSLHDRVGKLQDEYVLPGIPTSLAVTDNGLLIIPYLSTCFSGEGVAFIELDQDKNKFIPCTAIPFTCPHQPVQTYPAAVTVSLDEKLAYVVHEDGAFISVISLETKTPVATWLIGHSISSLQILPGGQFALAPSRKFADLTLISLKSGQPISMTANSGRRLLNALAILYGM